MVWRSTVIEYMLADSVRTTLTKVKLSRPRDPRDDARMGLVCACMHHRRQTVTPVQETVSERIVLILPRGADRS